VLLAIGELHPRPGDEVSHGSRDDYVTWFRERSDSLTDVNCQPGDVGAADLDLSVWSLALTPSPTYAGRER